jgi:DNA-binding NarL/FixJ family response regulator
MPHPNAPFSFLEKTVNVLVVDDLPVFTSMIEEYLNPFKIYSVQTASSTREALDVLKTSKTRFHVCLFDLGLFDVERNEFFLLDKYGKKMPFVIMSAQEDTEKSFEAKKRGAKAYVRKGDDFVRNVTLQCNRQALRSIVCPVSIDNPMSPIFRFLETLISKKPYFITDWAREANITDRHLRSEWEEHVGFSPKYSLCLYHLFSCIFEQIEAFCKNDEDPKEFCLDRCLQSIEKTPDCKRLMEYFLLNRTHVMASMKGSFSYAS